MITRLKATLSICLAVAGLPSLPESAVAQDAAPPSMRRLTQEQYRNVIADVFGADVKVEGRFPFEPREDGLKAIGAASASLSPADAGYYFDLARRISLQVSTADRVAKLPACAKQMESTLDMGCLRSFVSSYGRLLFHRPVDRSEVVARVQEAEAAAALVKKPMSAYYHALVGLLVAPDFLFRIERPIGPALNDYAVASRLSFLLWNAGPDAELLAAAEAGKLRTPKQIGEHVDRLMASPRFETGVRAFFSDFLALDLYDNLAKDGQIYPQFSFEAATASREEVLRVIVDLLMKERGDYRDLFTTNETYVTRDLGYLYNIPVKTQKGWEKITRPDNGHHAGILSMASFVALHSHPVRSSPTLRGKALRELLLCQPTPEPPGNVDFTLIEKPTDELRTARNRLDAHNSNPVCAGCHKLMDPLGLPFEVYDGAGAFRESENGGRINTSGVYNGKPFANASELGQLLHDDPQTARCLVTRAYGYFAGRAPHASEREEVAELSNAFAQNGYNIPDFFRTMATSSEMYRSGPGRLALDRDGNNRAMSTGQ